MEERTCPKCTRVFPNSSIRGKHEKNCFGVAQQPPAPLQQPPLPAATSGSVDDTPRARDTAGGSSHADFGWTDGLGGEQLDGMQNDGMQNDGESTRDQAEDEARSGDGSGSAHRSPDDDAELPTLTRRQKLAVERARLRRESAKQAAAAHESAMYARFKLLKHTDGMALHPFRFAGSKVNWYETEKSVRQSIVDFDGNLREKKAHFTPKPGSGPLTLDSRRTCDALLLRYGATLGVQLEERTLGVSGLRARVANWFKVARYYGARGCPPSRTHTTSRWRGEMCVWPGLTERCAVLSVSHRLCGSGEPFLLLRAERRRAAADDARW